MALKNLPDNFYINAGKPVDAKYFNPSNQPYSSTAEVYTTIPIAERSYGLTVNINYIEFWFKDDLNVLVVKSVDFTNGEGTTWNTVTKAFDLGGIITTKRNLTGSTDASGILETYSHTDGSNTYSTVIDRDYAKVSLSNTLFENGDPRGSSLTLQQNIGELTTTFYNGLAYIIEAIHVETNGSYFKTANSGFGLRYLGFGEDALDTPGPVDYSTLAFNSLTPRKYVDDAIAAVTVVGDQFTMYGRVTAGTGSYTNLTPSQIRTVVGNGLTAGSVLFSDGSTIQQNNANFFWNDSTNTLSLGQNTGTARLTVKGDGTNNIVNLLSNGGVSRFIFADSGDVYVEDTQARNRIFKVKSGTTLFQGAVGVGLEVGMDSQLPPAGSVYLGYQVADNHTTGQNVFVGYQVQYSNSTAFTGSGNLFIGKNINSFNAASILYTSVKNIAIGAGFSVGHNNTIILNPGSGGATQTTADNQFIVGATTSTGFSPIYSWWMTPPVSTNASQNGNQDKGIYRGTVTAANGNTSMASNTMSLYGAQSYGTGKGGDVKIAISKAGAGGSLNSFVDIFRVHAEGRVSIADPGLGAAGALAMLHIKASAGTDYMLIQDSVSANVFNISSAGNFGFNTNVFQTSSAGVLALKNAATPPSGTGSAVDIHSYYSADGGGLAGNASPFFRTENGTIIDLYRMWDANTNNPTGVLFAAGDGYSTDDVADFNYDTATDTLRSRRVSVGGLIKDAAFGVRAGTSNNPTYLIDIDDASAGIYWRVNTTTRTQIWGMGGSNTPSRIVFTDTPQTAFTGKTNHATFQVSKRSNTDGEGASLLVVHGDNSDNTRLRISHYNTTTTYNPYITRSAVFVIGDRVNGVSGNSVYNKFLFCLPRTSSVPVPEDNAFEIHLNYDNNDNNITAVSRGLTFDGHAVLRIFNPQGLNAVSPTASTVDAALLYTKDIVAGNAALHTRTENGEVISFATETNLRTIVADDTLVLTDYKYGKLNMVVADSASPIVVTIPPNASVAFPIGTVINVRRKNTGTVEIIEGAGVTIESVRNGVSKIMIANRYGAVSLQKEGTNTWSVLGNTEI